MKKTLLAAAATLAVGTLASQAQVYSQNIVGYVNVTVPATGYALVANQLINGSDSNQTNNNIQTALSSGGYVSDSSGSGNCTTLSIWNGGGFTAYQYFSAADAAANSIGTQAGWYDDTYTYCSVANGNAVYLNQVQGAFIYNNVSTNIVVTLIGTVPQGTNVVTFAPGYSLVSVAAPLSEDINSAGFVGSSDSSGSGDCTTLSVWNGAGFTAYQYFSAADAAANSIGTLAGWYDDTYTYQVVAPPVGQAFFVYQPTDKGTINWTNSFSVN